MKKIEARGAVTRAILARQIMGQVFDYAILHGRAETNPTTPLKRQIARRTVEHHRHLEERDIGDFLRKLEDYTGHITTRTALHLLMLTAVRPGEMCGAAWAEFDLEAATWTIPAKRMKMRRVHIVPLSRQAVELLRELEKVTGDGAYLFPTQGTKSETIPPATLRNAVRKLGYAERFSPHGARGTFSTLMNSRGYNADWIEKQLAHDDSDAVRKSYNHAMHLGDRATMMQDYADLLDEKRQGAQVIQLRKVAA
jgi:integrase